MGCPWGLCVSDPVGDAPLTWGAHAILSFVFKLCETSTLLSCLTAEVTQGGAALTITHSWLKGPFFHVLFVYLFIYYHVRWNSSSKRQGEAIPPSPPLQPYLGNPCAVRNGHVGKGETADRAVMVKMTAAGKSAES